MDPAVRIAYDMPTAWTLYSGAFDLKRLAALGKMPWSKIVELDAAAGQQGDPGPAPWQLVGAGIDWSAPENVPSYSEIECCNKKPREHYVDFVQCR